VTSRARQLLYARTHSRTGAGRGHHPNEITRIAPLSADAEPLALVWADLLGRARVNARIAARHLVFIVVAGAIAAFGVISQNQILIVGRVQPARAEHRIPDTRELADHPGRPGRRNRRDEPRLPHVRARGISPVSVDALLRGCVDSRFGRNP
jgi:hypothetical protein